MKVHILTIGDEILIGQIVNTNAAWMGEYMTLKGAQITGISSVADEQESILNALINAQKIADVVLISGGLGPTKDDITKKTLADHFGLEMYFHQETYDSILRLFERFGKSSTDAHKEQAYMPKGALILKNKMGTAPGMWFEFDGKVVVSMPGVPYEMKYLMENEVGPKLFEKFTTVSTIYKTIMTAGEGESRIADKIAPVTDKFPSNAKLAFLPNLGVVRLRVGIEGDDLKKNKENLNNLVQQIESLIPELVYGYDEIKLEQTLMDLMIAKKLSLCTAESCTGGYISHRLTSFSGSSAFFKGGLIAYSNEIKKDELKVSAKTLLKHGAVSEETVIEMANGARKAFGTDVAIAVSGIAGPTGGTIEKPVGTIWLAISDQNLTETYKLQLGRNRLKNIEYTGNYALNALRRFVLAKYSK